MTRSELLAKLPPFTNRSITIRKNQTVNDIVKEVLAAHQIFASDYEAIADDFNFENNIDTAKALFAFLKKNVRYKIESEAKQTTKSPAAIIETGTGDCKHYSGFVAGVLDALKRQGKNIDWNYRFASYNLFDSQPGHVFVVLNEGGNEVWIDPVLKNFNERLEPTYILDKRPKSNLMLSRVSGLGFIQPTDEPFTITEPVYLSPTLVEQFAEMPVDEIYSLAMQTGDETVPPEITKAIAVLMKYGVMDAEGRVNDDVLKALSETLSIEQFEEIANARITMHTAAINGFFGDIWDGIKSAGSAIWTGAKKVGLAVPRNAYLTAVSLNIFGLGSKLGHLLYKSDGSYDWANEKKLADKWRSLGGSWGSFKSAIQSGMKKKAVLGEANTIGEPVTFAGIVAAASTIIAALKPLIDALLRQRQQEEPNMYSYGVCADGFTPRNPDGSCPASYTPPTSGIMDFVKNNPVVVIGAGAAVAYFLTKPKRG